MGEAFEFGEYHLDVETSALWRGREVVDLPPKAIALLRVLAEYRGDVVSKQEIMNHVWPDGAVDEANLSVTVALLRKALDPQADGASYIQTLSRRGYRLVAAVRGGGGSQRPSLAVLPLLPLGPGIAPHLGVGLADALIRRLTVIPGLVVRPTTAVLHYGEGAASPSEVAQELGVDAVLTGTLQHDQQRLRVSLQLVPRQGSMDPWADVFDVDWSDLFKVQDDLATRVVLALGPHVHHADGGERRAPRHRPSPETYETYLRGRYFWARLDVEGVSKAFGCFGEAALADPSFAEPHASLSAAHILLAFSEIAPPRSGWTLAEECATRALEIDPSLAEAHVSKGFVALFRDWDWAAARAALDLACDLAPGAGEWRLWRALFHTLAGHPESAQKDILRLRESDPLSLFGSAVATLVSLSCEDRAPALEMALRAADLRPDRFLGHLTLALAQLESGRPEDACRSMRRAVAASGDGPVMRAFLAYALAVAGEVGEARALLDALGTSRFATLRARVLAALGETDGALAALEEGADRRDPWVVFLGIDGAFATLEADPRFEKLRDLVLGPRGPRT